MTTGIHNGCRKKVVGDDMFSTLDVCRMLGLKRERLRDWMNRGFIEPGTYLKQPKTAADIAVFMPEELFRTYLFKVLLDVGYTRKYASEIANAVDTASILMDEVLTLTVAWPKDREVMKQITTEPVDRLIHTTFYWKPIRDMLYKKIRQFKEVI